MTTAPLTVVLLAAGASTRFGADKLVVPVEGRPVIDICLDTLEASPSVRRVVVVAPVVSDVADRVRRWTGRPTSVVPGGPTRHLSEQAGLAEVLAGEPTELVAFHDAARPFASAGLIEALVEAARAADGAVPVVPAGEPLFRRHGARLAQLSPAPMRVQTPQVFRTEVAVAAFAVGGGEGDLDTAQTVARTGAVVVAVPGEAANLKITHPADIDARRRRAGSIA